MNKLSSHIIRVVMADDHEVFREGFQSMLKKQKEIELVGEAENGDELLRLAALHVPDVIITDIKMPKMDGVEATRLLMERYPHLHIIALSMFDDEELIMDMLEAGAKGYLLKNAHKTEIIEAIKTVYGGDPYYSNHITHKMTQLIANSKYNPFKKKTRAEFTPKEIEVIRLICAGLTNKEIAKHLALSVRTIEGHREKIHEKTKIKTVAGLVIYAIRKGFCKI